MDKSMEVESSELLVCPGCHEAHKKHTCLLTSNLQDVRPKKRSQTKDTEIFHGNTVDVVGGKRQADSTFDAPVAASATLTLETNVSDADVKMDDAHSDLYLRTSASTGGSGRNLRSRRSANELPNLGSIVGLDFADVPIETEADRSVKPASAPVSEHEPPPREQSDCAACHGAHRKHTCAKLLQSSEHRSIAALETEADRSVKPVSAPVSEQEPPPREQSDCAACHGAHRKHTCGKMAPQNSDRLSRMAPKTEADRSAKPAFVPVPTSQAGCAACHGAHRKHTCAKNVSPQSSDHQSHTMPLLVSESVRAIPSVLSLQDKLKRSSALSVVETETECGEAEAGARGRGRGEELLSIAIQSLEQEALSRKPSADAFLYSPVRSLASAHISTPSPEPQPQPQGASVLTPTCSPTSSPSPSPSPVFRDLMIQGADGYAASPAGRQLFLKQQAARALTPAPSPSPAPVLSDTGAGNLQIVWAQDFVARGALSDSSIRNIDPHVLGGRIPDPLTKGPRRRRLSRPNMEAAEASECNSSASASSSPALSPITSAEEADPSAAPALPIGGISIAANSVATSEMGGHSGPAFHVSAVELLLQPSASVNVSRDDLGHEEPILVEENQTAAAGDEIDFTVCSNRCSIAEVTLRSGQQILVQFVPGRTICAHVLRCVVRYCYAQQIKLPSNPALSLPLPSGPISTPSPQDGGKRDGPAALHAHTVLTLETSALQLVEGS